MEQFDLIIIGGGPAGATLARLAGGTRRILLVDGNRRGKPCGGLLAPDAQKILAHFDLNLPKEVLADPQIFSVKTLDLRSQTARWYQRMYVNLDRARFDRWLLSLIPEGVEVRSGRCTRLSRREDGLLEVSLNLEGGGSFDACAPLLVGADGAGSLVRRTFFAPLATRRYTAIQQHFPAAKTQAHSFYSCIFDERFTDVCAWTISKDDALIFGGAFPVRQSREAFEAMRRELVRQGFPLEQPFLTEACAVLRPASPASFRLGGGGVYLIGEAAGFVSPSSLEGISYAMKSAVLLGRAFEGPPGSILARYRRSTRSLRLGLLLKNIKCLGMYVPVLRRVVLRSGMMSIAPYPGLSEDRNWRNHED